MASITQVSSINISVDNYKLLAKENSADFLELKIKNIPVYIFHSHHMALYPWKLYCSNDVLYTIDTHMDMLPVFDRYNFNNSGKLNETNINFNSLDEFEKSVTYMNTDEQIDAAIKLNLFGSAIGYVKNNYTIVINKVQVDDMRREGTFEDCLRKISQNDSYALDIDLDYFQCSKMINGTTKLNSKNIKLITIAIEDICFRMERDHFVGGFDKYPLCDRNNCERHSNIPKESRDQITDYDEACSYSNLQCLNELLKNLDDIIF